MALKPEKEVVVCAYDKDVSPGFVYDFSTKEYSPGNKRHTINIEKFIPEYKIEVKSKEDLSSLKNSEVIKNASWTQDFDITFSDCILVQGQKICEHKSNVEPHQKLSVVSSVYYKSFIDMLICFSNQIEKKDIEDLKSYMESVIYVNRIKMAGDSIQTKDEGTDFNRCQPDATAFIIPGCICNAFSVGYIYEKGKRTEVLSIKYGLEEFCYYLVHSETSKFPMTCKVKYPSYTAQVSYASVVKNESTSNVHDKILDCSLIGQSYCTGGLSASVAHTVKSSQGIKFPDTHNTQRNAKVKDSNNTPFRKHSVEAVKELDAHYPRTRKTFSREPVNKSGKQQLTGCQVSDRKSCHLKGSEVHNTSEIPQDNACTHDSRNATCLQSSQNLTRKSENVELNMCVSKNCNKSDELRLENSSVQNRSLEEHFQEKPNFPHSLHVAGDMNPSEKPESSIEKSKLKFEHKNVNAQIMSEKSHGGISNIFESNAESSTLLMPLKESEVCGMTRKYYGVISEAEGKTIILLGASGSGKTTLVNFIANYFSDNKTAAGKLIKVVRSSNDIQGHTSQITGYTFCAGEDDNPLTIIDTPGLNDSSGAEVHDHVQSLKTFLANADSQSLKIHAIGFVAQAHIVRLTSSERLVMGYISSLFGKEIGNHVISFVTFSDSQEVPPVVEAISNYGVSCSVFLKFNNSALSSNKDEEIDELDRIYWRIGCKSWKKCIKLLEKLPPLSFKSLIDEIYMTQIMEMAERDLRTEIMGFVNHYGRNKVITEKVLNNAERVWILAEAVKELRCINVSRSSTVDNILLSHVEELCTVKNSCLSTKECMKLLSLSPSRPLLKSGLAIISSIAPLYNTVKQKHARSQNLTKNENIPDVLFCHQCEKDHVLEKLPCKSKQRIWSFAFSSKPVIVYKCTQCRCDGSVHGEKDNENKKHEVAESYGFTPDKLLHLTKNCIEKVLEDLCLQEHRIHENEYIKFLKYLVKQEAQQLCIDLLRTN